MAQIRPFRGILYNSEKVTIADVIAPPYDVISSNLQEYYYKRSKNNIVRIILGKDEKNDTVRRSKYTRAEGYLTNWLQTGVFLRDKKPCLYIYSQEYLHKGKKRTRIGFIALMKIEDPKESGILPHEYTLDKPKEDRLRLINAAKGNLSPIFSLYQDKKSLISGMLKNYVKTKKPICTIEVEGVGHRLWKMESRALIGIISRSMKSKKIFIADGHHRYEVALAYRNKMREARSRNKNTDYVMMYFTSLSEKSGSLTVLSTHRVLKNLGKDKKNKIFTDLKKYFYMEKVSSLEKMISVIELCPKGKHAFGMYSGKNEFYILSLKNEVSVKKLTDSKKPHLLKKLDVTILHDFIINELLDVKNTENKIKYIRDEKICASLIDKGDYEMAFFLRPTAVSDMKAVAETGEMMPQKSTYFYPKLLSGLVINKF